MFLIVHTIEGRQIVGICAVVTRQRVGASTSDQTVRRQQPQIQFHLCLERLHIVSLCALRLHAALEVRVSQQCKCCQRVLIEFVRVAASDLPCPATIHSAAPRSIPRHQVMLTSGFICVVGPAIQNIGTAADLLIVLIIHIISQFVTHLTSQSREACIAAPLAVNGLVANAPSICSIYCLNCTVFCVRRIGVAPLLSRTFFGIEEALHTSSADTILQCFNTCVRQSFPTRFGSTTLECIDHCEGAANILLLVRRIIVTIPVIYVSQPVQQIQTLIGAAVCTGEVLVNRVVTVLISMRASRIVFGVVPFSRIGSLRSICIGHVVLVIAALYVRNQCRFQSFPSLCSVTNGFTSSSRYSALVYNVITHCSNPYQVRQGFRCCFVTIVRSFDTQLFYRVVRNVEATVNGCALAHVAIGNTICDNVIIQRHETFCISGVTILFCLCSGASSRSSSRQQCTACHGSS